MRSAKEIDAEDGITNRVHMMTIILAKMSNPKLFDLLIKKRLRIKDLENLTFVEMPHEVDAVLFITNPMLIFELLLDIIKFREKHKGFVFTYLTNRVARWLFCFTQFLMRYDEFEKMVSLTLLHYKRFAPNKEQFRQTIHLLCKEVQETVEKKKKSVFMNDLRRLYMILSRALFISTREGKHAPPEIRAMLAELNAVVIIDANRLKEDEIYPEFIEFHFATPSLKSEFHQQYRLLKEQDIGFTFEFLGYLHEDDRHLILLSCYHQSKIYILDLLSKLKLEFKRHGESIPEYHNLIVTSINKIIDYKALLNDPEIDNKLVNSVFSDGQIVLGGQFVAAPKPQPFQKTSPLPEFIPAQDVFDTFYFGQEEALEKNYLQELAWIPFCYLKVDLNGQPTFNILTFGEISLLDLPAETYEDLLDYLLLTGQIAQMERVVYMQQRNALFDFGTRLCERLRFEREAVETYNSHHHLKFDMLKISLEKVRRILEENHPEYFKRVRQKQRTMVFLKEIEQWLADRKKLKPHKLAPDDIPHLLKSYQAKEVYTFLRRTATGVQHAEQLKALLEHEKEFTADLLTIHKINMNLLAHERVRFQDGPHQEGEGEEDLVELETIDLTSLESRENAFAEMAQNAENKEVHLMEWGRMPFRMIKETPEKCHIVTFTFAEIVAMNMDGITRKTLMNFLLSSQQLSPSELRLMNQHMTSFLMLVKRLTHSLKWPDEHLNWIPENGNIDIAKFSQLGDETHSVMEKQLKQLILHKNQTVLALECLEELQRWIVQGTDTDYKEVDAKAMYRILNAPQNAARALKYLQSTSWGDKHLVLLSCDEEEWNVVCQRLKREYEINTLVFEHFKKIPTKGFLQRS